MKSRIIKIVIIILTAIVSIANANEQSILPHEEHSILFGGEQIYEMPNIAFRPFERSPSALSHEVYGFLPYWEYTAYDCPRYDLLTRVAYFEVTLNSYGNVSNYRHWPATALITAAHSQGCAVDVCIAVFNDDDIASIVNNPTNRSNACKTICNVMAMGADGVNIDFELPPSTARAGFYAFMRELADSIHTRDSEAVLSLCLPPVDWRNTFNSDSLLPHTDILFLMGYGYYYGGSSSTGPLAPLDDPGCTYDIAYSVSAYCGSNMFKRSRFIVGLPLYGYDWPCTGSYRGATTTGSGSAKFYRTCVAETLTYGCNFDVNAPAPWYVYGSYRQCWWDDARSLDEKYRWTAENNLMGVGFWALGYDDCDPVFWEGIRDVFGDSVVHGDSIIIDNGDPEFVTGGTWYPGTYAPESGWWGDYTFCNSGGTDDWATWTPNLPDSGYYDIYMWWLAGSNRCDSVFVRIFGVENESLFVSQKGSGAEWHYLGRKLFDSGSGGYVGISDRTAVNGSVVIADAVLWIPFGTMEIAESEYKPKEISIRAFPNPFNAECTFELYGEWEGENISIYDISGRLIKRLPITEKRVIWNGTDNRNEAVPGGIYFVAVSSQRITITLLK